MRTCGECKACCEGWLEGEVRGQKFFRGRPCSFISCNGCTIYEERPKDPCQSYTCLWLTSESMPEWMRPDKSKVILTHKVEQGVPYVYAMETSTKMDSAILSWIVQSCFNNNWNLRYTVDFGNNYLGSKEFVNLMRNPKGEVNGK